ncbi:MAG: hypothetical protein ACREDR_19465 [Blastocatellia bacterium]
MRGPRQRYLGDMENFGLLDPIPLWALLLLTVVVGLLSVEIGYRLARYRRKRSEAEKEAPVGGMVGGALGLLAFMLAFTFGLATSRFEERRQIVVAEANAIGTTYLRAAMLPEPMRTQTRDLLRQYVEIRIEGINAGNAGLVLSKSDELQDRLWSEAVAATEKDRSPIVGLFVDSLNEVIDLHAKRVMVGLRSRIPGAIWTALYLLAILAMVAMGYHEGLTGSGRSLAVLPLVVAFCIVLILVVDVDRPGEGLVEVSQQTMVDLHKSMVDTSSAQTNIRP